MQRPNWTRFTRKPDFYIGGPETPYLIRWWILPRNAWFNIYLHKMERDDDDRALHDHPWPNCSIVLKGRFLEMVPKEPMLWPANREVIGKVRSRGNVVFRKAEDAHRLVKIGDGSWTLFITGRRLREWGFWCDWGWRHHTEFTAGPNGEYVGKGCGE